MPNVVFVVPFLLENTLRFVRAAQSLPGVRLGIVSQEPQDRLPNDVRQGLAGFQQVQDAMAGAPLGDGVQALGRQLGSVESLLGILEPLQVPLAEVRERLRIRGMAAATAHNFRDKARMKQLFEAHDIPCARHRLCSSAAMALQFAQELGYPLVVKPPAGAGAKTTARCDQPQELQSFLQSVPPAPGRELLLEEFVQGREFSFDSVTLGGRHLLHNINDYHPTPLHVLQNPWIQWCVVTPRDISGPDYQAIHATGPRALTALSMVTGMTHMEWFRRADGSIAIGEVAARPPGAQFMTLMSYVYDVDMYRAWAQLMVFETFQPRHRVYAAGAAYLRGQGEGQVKAIEGLEQARSKIGALVVEARLPQPGQAKAGSYEGEGYVIVRHPDTAVVTDALQQLVSTLRVELG
ncbi:MAG TPA: ATP-grasp domain-containing protein [Planctomycetota bacterium]|nr:ATP-grasp domain-containing protein [Planctomycetota bacterium]